MTKNTIKALRQVKSGSFPSIISSSNQGQMGISSPSPNLTLLSVVEKQSCCFQTTHLLIGRLSHLSKDSPFLISISVANLKVQFNKDEFAFNYDKENFQLFALSDPLRYHVLFTLLEPVMATSTPLDSKSSYPLFSFSYKAKPPHLTQGTSNRFTF